jgi:AraC-like DNA-binding protein
VTPQAHPPTRSRVVQSRPDDIRAFLEHAYGIKMRRWDASIDPADGPMTHVRTDVGLLALEEIRLPGVIECELGPVNKVIGGWINHGKLVGRNGDLNSSAGAGEVTLISQPGLANSVRAEDLRLISVLLDPVLVASVATGLPIGQSSLPVRFGSFQPVSTAAERLWKRTVGFIKNDVLATDAAATSLVVGHAGRLLAAVTLETFPHTKNGVAAPHDRADHHPALLRRAIEYIESNADKDISLHDIAEAVHVTPRAVQYMFRRHLELTPMQYLRELRMRHAHEELLAADRLRETVGAIAARWGFAHTGRFAVQYRQTYGQSPHQTLRG